MFSKSCFIGISLIAPMKHNRELTAYQQLGRLVKKNSTVTSCTGVIQNGRGGGDQGEGLSLTNCRDQCFIVWPWHVASEKIFTVPHRQKKYFEPNSWRSFVEQEYAHINVDTAWRSFTIDRTNTHMDAPCVTSNGYGLPSSRCSQNRGWSRDLFALTECGGGLLSGITPCLGIAHVMP